MIRKTTVPSWAKKFNIEVENDVKKEQEQKKEKEQNGYKSNKRRNNSK